MNRPLLPSEKHPDYPKCRVDHNAHPLPIVYPVSREEMAAFYKAHPEFNDEGEYRFECPYCGDELSDDWRGCCGEAGHGEWVLVDANGERIED